MIDQGKQKLTILSGVSGSGKSTLSTSMCKQFRNHLRVNRDDLRKQLVGELTPEYYKRADVARIEKEVSHIQNLQIHHLLVEGYSVIIDNTHLKEKYINEILNKFNGLVDVELLFIDTATGVCMERVIKREDRRNWIEKLLNIGKKVNIDYIIKQATDFINLRRAYPNDKYFFPIKKVENG